MLVEHMNKICPMGFMSSTSPVIAESWFTQGQRKTVRPLLSGQLSALGFASKPCQVTPTISSCMPSIWRPVWYACVCLVGSPPSPLPDAARKTGAPSPRPGAAREKGASKLAIASSSVRPSCLVRRMTWSGPVQVGPLLNPRGPEEANHAGLTSTSLHANNRWYACVA